MKNRYMIPLGIVGLMGLVFWSNASKNRGGISAPDGAALVALSPAQRAFRGTGNYASDVASVVFGRKNLASEVARLERQVANLEGQNARLLRYRRENDELRSLLKMPKIEGGRAIAAEVIFAQASGLSRKMTINVGARAGVAPKDVAYCAQGLVGQITQVSPFSSVVTLPTDREGAVGAMVLRSGARGVLLGNGNRVAKLSYLSFTADVREGDVVVTSGLSDTQGAVFPRGIVIGKVLKIQKNAAYGRQEAFVAPSAPLENLGAVWVRAGQSQG